MKYILISANEAAKVLNKLIELLPDESTLYRISDLMCSIGHYHTLARVMLDMLELVNEPTHYKTITDILFNIGRIDLIEKHPVLENFLTNDHVRFIKSVSSGTSPNLKKVLVLDHYNRFPMTSVISETYMIWRLLVNSRYLNEYSNVLARAIQWADAVWIDGLAENTLFFLEKVARLSKMVILRIMVRNPVIWLDLEEEKDLFKMIDWVVFTSDFWKDYFKSAYPHTFDAFANRTSVVYPHMDVPPHLFKKAHEISSGKVLIIVHDETTAPLAAQIALNLKSKKNVTMLIRVETTRLVHYITKFCESFLDNSVPIINKITEEDLKTFEWIVSIGVDFQFIEEIFKLLSRGYRTLVHANPHTISVIPSSILFNSISELMHMLEQNKYALNPEDFSPFYVESVRKQVELTIEKAV